MHHGVCAAHIMNLRALDIFSRRASIPEISYKRGDISYNGVKIVYY